MNHDVAEVLAELDAHRARFEAFCRSLSEEQLARPVPRSTWEVKDFISHLATIDEPITEMFRFYHTGVRGNSAPLADVDTWNETQVQERRTWNVDRIFAGATEQRAELRAALSELTAEDIAKPMKFGGDSKRGSSEFPLALFIRGWNKHDPMHAMDMVRALPEVVTPELEAWFDHPAIANYQAAMNQD